MRSSPVSRFTSGTKAAPLGAVHFAASDLGGLPLLEEAQWAGVRAAEEALAAMNVPFESSL